MSGTNDECADNAGSGASSTNLNIRGESRTCRT